MSESIAWAGDPPANPTARIWRPTANPEWVVVLGPWHGVWVHWMGRRSLPCLKKQCPAARHRKPQVWLGYTPIAVNAIQLGEWTTHYWKSAIVALGPGPADEVLSHLSTYPGPLLKVSLEQKGKGVKVHEIKPLKPGIVLPDCPDVEATLYRVWQMRPPSQPASESLE